METYKQHLGKEMSFNKQTFNNTTKFFNTHLAPSIRKVKTVYETFSIGKFSNEVFHNLLDPAGIKEVEIEYSKALNEDIVNLKIKTLAAKQSMLNAVPDQISLLLAQRDNMLETFDNSYQLMHNNEVLLNWKHVSIVNGEPVLAEEVIREELTQRITNDLQAKLYQKTLDLKEKHDEYFAFLKENGINLRPEFSPTHGQTAVFYLDENRQLQISPAAPFVLERLQRMQDHQTRVSKQAAQQSAKLREQQQKELDNITQDFHGRKYDEPLKIA